MGGVMYEPALIFLLGAGLATLASRMRRAGRLAAQSPLAGGAKGAAGAAGDGAGGAKCEGKC